MHRPSDRTRSRVALTLLSVVLAASVRAQIEPAADAPQPSPPEASREMFQLADGFRIDLIASEPLLADPTGVTWDADGRLFVCELHGYNLEGQLDVDELNKTGVLDREVRRIQAPPEAKRAAEEGTYGTVKRLEDVDGDGRMDRAHIWADRLPPCYGVIATRGGVLVTCAPDIVFLADRDGDDVAEIRETLFTGFGTGALERGINSPQWGLDNWIWIARGRGGRISGPHLTGAVEIGNTDLRVLPDGSAIEPVTGASGTFGHAFTEAGDRFLIGGGNHAYFASPIDHRALLRNPHVPSPRSDAGASSYSRVYPTSEPHPWRVKRGSDPNWVRFYGSHEATPGGNFTSACSPLIYSADAFPAAYRGNHFSCEPQNNLVHRCLVERDGSGYRVRRAPEEAEREFLSSSEKWFRPMSLALAPDGSLWVVDMYREIIEDYSAIPRYLQQQYGLTKGSDRGRIWRVSHEDAPPREPPRLSEADDDALVSLTGDANAWRRETARRLLIEREARSARDALLARARTAASAPARLAALATLDGLGVLRPEDLSPLLADRDWQLRRHALRALRGTLERSRSRDPSAVLDSVIACTRDEDPSVRLEAALALGDFRSLERRRAGALADLARDHGADAWMPNAIASSLAGLSIPTLDALLEKDEGRSRDALDLLARTIGARGDDDEVTALLVRAAKLHREDARARTLLVGLDAGLRGGGRSDRDAAVVHEEDSAGPTALLALLEREDEETRAAAFRVVGALRLESTPFLSATFAQAAERATDETLSVATRVRALRLFANASIDAKHTVCAELLDARHAVELQLAAIDALAESEDPRVSTTLLERVEGFSPQVRESALDVLFARADRLPALLDAIEMEQLDPRGLGAFRRVQLREHEDASIRDRARALLAESATIDETTLARFTQALDGARDPARGAAVYREHCTRCHRVSDEGADVGPNLASERERADLTLLVDVLDPSRILTAGYEAYVATTRDGRVASGVLSNESATSVTLRQAGGEETTILRRELASLRTTPVSLMPANFAELLQPRDLADLIAFLRSEFGAAIASSVTLFDEEEDFPARLVDGGGTARVVSGVAHSGSRSLTVTPPQRYSVRIPGWSFRVAENPQPGEYRYLRLAWRSVDGQGVMLELAANGAWPAAKAAERRYHSGKNTSDWASIEVAPEPPREWTLVTVDLWRDNGTFTLTGIAPTAMGGVAHFDRIELLRTLEE